MQSKHFNPYVLAIRIFGQSRTFFLSVFLANLAFAQLVSPFPSTVSELSIPNAHILEFDGNNKGKVLRGMAPLSPLQYDQLVDYGITDVLVFKNKVKNEIEEEKNFFLELEKKKGKHVEVHSIPFKWKGITDFREACEQTLQALAILIDVKRSTDKRVFFHCTVGEDRTGYLAGLYRIAAQHADFRQVFEKEMCENGYGAGNPNKLEKREGQPSVADLVQENLTPLFLKMAYKFNKGDLSEMHLDQAQCLSDPGKNSEFLKDPDYDVNSYMYKCQRSSKYP